MKLGVRSVLFLVSVTCLAVSLSGCGGKDKKIIIKGKLLDGGAPLNLQTSGPMPPGDSGVELIFYPVLGEKQFGDPQPAAVNVADSTFELIGADAKGVKPGKYLVTLSVGPKGAPDKLKNAFSLENSKIEREITGDASQEIIIDVKKPTG